MDTEDKHYRPYSIERAGGLEPHLNAMTTLGYAPFREAMEKGITIAGKPIRPAREQDIMDLYGVTRPTAKGWMARYRYEQKAKQKGGNGHGNSQSNK